MTDEHDVEAQEPQVEDQGPQLSVGHEHHARALLVQLAQVRQARTDLEDELIKANAKLELVIDRLNLANVEKQELADALAKMEERLQVQSGVPGPDENKAGRKGASKH